ncbi:MAG: response regulator [Desulfovibrio sp.]|jgi:signal transduction histidine kinase/CheY-like chemotaxis protein/HPt (histidine-containing phosphotransfer) domain-containing protein|nr:response regulator [Desulfovibrio sp.]
MFPKNIILLNAKKLFFVFVFCILIVTISYKFASNIVERQIMMNAEETLDVAEITESAKINELSIILHAASFVVQRDLDKQTVEHIKSKIVELYTNFLHYSVIPEDLYLYGYINDQFLAGDHWTPPEDFSAQRRPWFTEAMEQPGSIVLIPPYVDSRTGIFIITLAKTLHNADGEFRGVLCIDIPLTTIAEAASGLRLAKSGYGSLLTNDLIYAAYVDDRFIGTRMRDLSPGHARLADLLQSGVKSVSNFELSNSNGIQTITFYKQMRNGWYIGLSTPSDLYFKDVYLMAAILSIICFILLVSSSYFIIRLSMEKSRSDEENISKSTFLAHMSHEIRTPLNSIIGMSDLILKKYISHEIKDFVSIIKQSGESLVSIINDILDFTKISSGQFNLEVRPYDFSSLLNDIINVMRIRLTDKLSIDFIVNADPNIPAELIGDEVRVRQILLNLLSNAAKYTNKGFISLTITAVYNEGNTVNLLFRVKDSGIGIKQDDIDKLFIEFMRLDLENTQKIEGTGLGLAITNTLCTMMNGKLSVESVYGRGSTFIATVRQQYSFDDPLASVNNADQKNILLYEDRDLQKYSLLRAFKDLGLSKPPYAADSFKTFMTELESDNYDFAFISSCYAMDCLTAFEHALLQTQIVVMMEFGEFTAFSGISTILLPAYTATLANVLNGTVDSVSPYSTDEQPHATFSAPTAHVLIVDDVKSNLRVAKELVSLYGIQVDTCMTGDAAIQAVQDHHYDLLFIDHMMPGKNGIKTTAEIRKLNVVKTYQTKLPIVVLTANAVSGQREFFLQNGFDDFLSKPIDLHKLEQILEKWIPVEKHAFLPDLDSKLAVVHEPDELDVFHIDGIDVSLGINNVGGNIMVYRDILFEFYRDSKKRYEQIKDALDTKDFELYTIILHTLKGTSRTIGVNKEFSQLAYRLEMASSLKNLDLLTAETDNFLYKLDILLKSIQIALHDVHFDINDITDISMFKFDILKNALQSMDIQTINSLLAEYSTMNLAHKQKELIADIEQNIINFEYDKAIELIITNS